MMKERLTRELLDHSLCLISGEFGSAMKQAFKIGDTALYEELREQRLQVNELRERIRSSSTAADAQGSLGVALEKPSDFS